MTEQGIQENEAEAVVPFYERPQVQMVNIPYGGGIPFGFEQIYNILFLFSIGILLIGDSITSYPSGSSIAPSEFLEKKNMYLLFFFPKIYNSFIAIIYTANIYKFFISSMKFNLYFLFKMIS